MLRVQVSGESLHSWLFLPNEEGSISAVLGWMWMIGFGGKRCFLETNTGGDGKWVISGDACWIEGDDRGCDVEIWIWNQKGRSFESFTQLTEFVLNMLPQTSSSQEALLSMTVSALTVDPFGFPTKLAKLILDTIASPADAPLAAIPDRSSSRWESRKNWSCSFSTRSASFFITSMNRWNWPTLSTEATC